MSASFRSRQAPPDRWRRSRSSPSFGGSACPSIELSAIVAVFAIGVWAAQGTEVALGRKDPGVVVIDEVLGMLITLALLPLSLTGIALGFLFFRVLDVIKPYPAAQLEHLHGGLGIMADDAVAGLYAHLALRACVWMVPAWLTA